VNCLSRTCKQKLCFQLINVRSRTCVCVCVHCCRRGGSENNFTGRPALTLTRAYALENAELRGVFFCFLQINKKNPIWANFPGERMLIALYSGKSSLKFRKQSYYTPFLLVQCIPLTVLSGRTKIKNRRSRSLHSGTRIYITHGRGIFHHGNIVA